MTPFERFCKENLSATSETFILNQEGKYLVNCYEDDGSDQINFKIVEVLDGSSDDYGVGEKMWGYIENLELASISVDGVTITPWDYATAARLKVKADAAVNAYNEYIAKRPEVDFVKY